MVNFARKKNQRLFYIWLFVSLLLLVWGWWSGSHATLHIPGGRLIALGRLFGLLATYTILLEVLLMARLPYFERNFDLHDIVTLHRWNGYGIMLSIVAHVVFLVLGYAAPGHVGLWHQFIIFNTQFSDVLLASLGTLVFFGATAITVNIVRKRLPYELWYLSHLTLYGAILFVAVHQLKTGGDFIGHFWFSAYWYMWFIGVFGLLAWYRFALPILRTLYHGFRVEQVVQEANDTYSVYISGRRIGRFPFEPGQYASWWILAPGMWWKAHPFSFSGQPGYTMLRFTAKASGDFTQQLASLKPGTHVIVDGGRGSFTADRAGYAENVVLIAGGIGVAPYLSSIQSFLDQGKHVTLLYAARTQRDVAFRDELIKLQQQGLEVKLFLSDESNRRIDEAVLAPYAQRPDTVLYICGPDSMSHGLSRTLYGLGVPKEAIITERFAY